MPFTFSQTDLPGVVVVEPRVFGDERGAFLETYKRSEFVAAGVTVDFVQDNHSVSQAGVLRGLHYQLPPYEQGKLVRVISGRAWDVAVDIRPDSPTFRQWVGVELSGENHRMLYIPSGFAHGFVALEDETHFVYKCTAEYDKASEGGIRWDDPDIAVEWPRGEVLVSEKDAALPPLAEARLP